MLASVTWYVNGGAASPTCAISQLYVGSALICSAESSSTWASTPALLTIAPRVIGIAIQMDRVGGPAHVDRAPVSGGQAADRPSPHDSRFARAAAPPERVAGPVALSTPGASGTVPPSSPRRSSSALRRPAPR